MTDWYYHDPAEGRVGPFTADDLRKRFSDRRIQRDTLVWHAGLREWQPLERMALDIGLEGMRVDASLPPPMPSGPVIASIATKPVPPVARGKYTRAPLQAKKTLSGGTIALIAVAAIAIPGALILASIALPAYQDYVRGADRMGALTGMAIALKREVGTYAVRSGHCPANDDAHVVRLRQELRRRSATEVRFATLDGGCAFELAIDADGQPIDGKAVRYEGYPDGNAFAWECVGGDMPAAYRPYECRDDG